MEILDDLKRKFSYWIDSGIVSLKLERGDDFYGLRYKYADGSEIAKKLDSISDGNEILFESSLTSKQAREAFFQLNLYSLLMTTDIFGSMRSKVFHFYSKGYEDFYSFKTGNKFGIYYTVYIDEPGFTTQHFAWFQNAFEAFNFLKFSLPFQSLTRFTFFSDDIDFWPKVIDQLVALDEYNDFILHCMEKVEDDQELHEFEFRKFLPEELRGDIPLQVHWVGSVQNIQDTKSPELKALLNDISCNNMPIEDYHSYAIAQLNLFQTLDSLDHDYHAAEYYIGDMLALYCTTDEETIAFLKERLANVEDFINIVEMSRQSKLNKNKAETCYSHYKAFFHEMLQKLLSENKEKN